MHSEYGNSRSFGANGKFDIVLLWTVLNVNLTAYNYLKKFNYFLLTKFCKFDIIYNVILSTKSNGRILI